MTVWNSPHGAARPPPVDALIIANSQNIVFLVVLGFAIAASANLPTLLLSLFWGRFNTLGSLCSTYGGLISCVVLIVLSPAVSGSRTSMIPSIDIAVFPLSNPGIVTIPLAVLFGVVGTFLGKPEPDAAATFAAVEVRSLLGADAVPLRADATSRTGR